MLQDACFGEGQADAEPEGLDERVARAHLRAAAPGLAAHEEPRDEREVVPGADGLFARGAVRRGRHDRQLARHAVDDHVEEAAPHEPEERAEEAEEPRGQGGDGHTTRDDTRSVGEARCPRATRPPRRRWPVRRQQPVDFRTEAVRRPRPTRRGAIRGARGAYFCRRARTAGSQRRRSGCGGERPTGENQRAARTLGLLCCAL